MKKILVAIFAIALLSSCHTLKTVPEWVKKHGETKTVGQYQVTTIKDIYPTEKIKQYAPYAVITWDISNATLELKTKLAVDSLLLKEVKKIEFKK